jgi:putative transposase
LRFLQAAGSVNHHIVGMQFLLAWQHAKRLKRFYGAGDLHYVTCSCYKRKRWLGTERRRDLFLKILVEVRKQRRFVVLGYVVMREHFHLLMSELQEGNPSTVVQSVKQRYA